MLRDHHLLFQSYSSQQPRHFGFITEWHCSQVEFSKLNRIQLPVAVCKAARQSIDWQDAACSLIFPLRQVTLAQWYKQYHQKRQCSKWKASLKAVIGFCNISHATTHASKLCNCLNDNNEKKILSVKCRKFDIFSHH